MKNIEQATLPAAFSFPYLPKGFTSSAHFRVAVRYESMTAVAGDFYNDVLADDRQAGLLIADLPGHGVPAALIASMVKLAGVCGRAFMLHVGDELCALWEHLEPVRDSGIRPPKCGIARTALFGGSAPSHAVVEKR
jgi:hypothetical protein